MNEWLINEWFNGLENVICVNCCPDIYHNLCSFQ